MLHVGAMKSGTSYLQALLFRNRDRLAAQGCVLPGERWVDQSQAVRQALTTAEALTGARWRALAEQVHAAPDAALVSMEFLGPARRAIVGEIVADLGAARTEVVLTVRDLNRSLPSMWQETIQNGRSWTWEDYLADVEAKRPGREDGEWDRRTPGGTFWRQQHVVRMVRRWAEVADQVTVVTVPHPGADRALLAGRFGEAAGIELQVPASMPLANESIGLPSLLALRAVNELLSARGLDYPAGDNLRKKVLAKQVLAGRRHEEPGLGLDVTDWVRAQSADTVAALREEGVRLVGEWSDLEPVAVRGAQPRDVPEAEVTAAAIAALAGLVERRIRRDQSSTGTQTRDVDSTA